MPGRCAVRSPADSRDCVPAPADAKKAAKAVKKGTGKKVLKPRFSVSFHRPRTQTRARKPKYARKSTLTLETLDDYAVIKHPLYNESAMAKIEKDNTLVFIVDVRADKVSLRGGLQAAPPLPPLPGVVQPHPAMPWGATPSTNLDN